MWWKESQNRFEKNRKSLCVAPLQMPYYTILPYDDQTNYEDECIKLMAEKITQIDLSTIPLRGGIACFKTGKPVYDTCEDLTRHCVYIIGFDNEKAAKLWTLAMTQLYGTPSFLGIKIQSVINKKGDKPVFRFEVWTTSQFNSDELDKCIGKHRKTFVQNDNQ